VLRFLGELKHQQIPGFWLTHFHLTSDDSPLTANIYFPAIPVISRDFHKSVELINLTVTMYMVMQGICTHRVAFSPSDTSIHFRSYDFSSDGVGDVIGPLGT
jgi:hypothetical protein